MTRLLWLQSDGNFEPPQDSKNKLFLAGIDEQGTKGYILTSLENLTNKHVADQASLMFECSRFLVLESPTKDQAFEFLYTNYPLPAPKQYPLKNLTLIKYSCFSTAPPAMFFHEYIEPQGGQCVSWDAFPAADVVWLLIHCETKLKLPFSNEEYSYSLGSSSTIEGEYKQFIADSERANI